jgi:hypothetical protein
MSLPTASLCVLLSWLLAISCHAETPVQPRQWQWTASAVDAKNPRGGILLQVEQTVDALVVHVGLANDDSFLLLNGGVINSSLAMIHNDKVETIKQRLATVTYPARGLTGLASLKRSTITFPWKPDTNPEKIGFMDLRIDGYNTIAIDFTKAKAQAAPGMDWDQLPQEIPISAELVAQHEGGAIFPVAITAIKQLAAEIEFTLSVENAHRLPVQWTGTLSGHHLRLILSNGSAIEPSAVSPTMATTLVPANEWLPSQSRHSGWVRFAKLTFAQAQQLTFALPGYRSLSLNFDPKTKSWLPDDTKPSTLDERKALVFLRKERSFTGMQSVWTAAFQDLKTDPNAWAKRFSARMREKQIAFAKSVTSVPVNLKSLQMVPSSDYRADEDGKVSNVLIHLDYEIRGLPIDNGFKLGMKADMQQTSKGGWLITGLRYEPQRPFWSEGYTAVKTTEHFMIFHRPDESGLRQADIAARDLEKSRARLIAARLTLPDKIAAFTVTRPEDFQALTGKDPRTYSGVAASIFMMRDNQPVVMNQALFLNDPRFSFLDRLWARRDHVETVQHELAHIALGQETMPWSPPWMVEGIAIFFAAQYGRQERAELEALLTPGLTVRNLTLIPYLGFSTNNALAVAAQYRLSGWVVQYLIEEHGLNKVLAFYRSFANARPKEWQQYGENGNADHLALARQRLSNTALKEHFDLDLDQLDAKAKAALR